MESFRIDHFYRSFKRSGLNHFPSLSKFKKHQKVSKSLYRKIISSYLRIYFYEAYFIDRKIYFFFGGYLFKVRCGNWIKPSSRDKKYEIANHAIGLFWSERPCPRFWFSIKIRKLKGKANIIPKIEKEWKSENDITLLEKNAIVKSRLKRKNKLFKMK